MQKKYIFNRTLKLYHYRKFEDLSRLISEENNWKVYRAELHETMSKGACVPFLGQFLTEILHQETVKELMLRRRKSTGLRPKSGNLNADNQETLSAPTTPMSSVQDDMVIVSEAESPTDLNLEQQTPTSSNTQPELLIEEVKGKSDELKFGVSQEEEESTKKKPSKSTKDGKKKRRWSRFRRKSAPLEQANSNANNCNDDAPHKKEFSKLRRILSSPLRSFSSFGSNSNNVQKKEKGFYQRKSSPATLSCNDDTLQKKEKRSLRKKLFSPLRGHSNRECNNDTPQGGEHPDVDGFDAHDMLQQMQFSSMRYMNSLNPRPDIQSFIKGLNYNTEEDDYRISIQREPIEQHNKY